MSDNDSEEIRSAAESIISQTRQAMPYRMAGFPPGFDITRTHSINLITEEFLGGYMQDGRMSVVRRFFCMFVTFDLFFVSLLWLICIMINGDNIFQAFQKQIIHYTIYTSLFDVVAAAICRFLILIVFYAFLYVNHWFIIALSTSGSCLFLISKVFVYNWLASNQQVFQVILILTSFVLAWGEAWFLDCRVIPQERHARRYFSNLSGSDDRSPLVAPFLTSSQNERLRPESISNFYSPLDSAHNSEDEEEKDDEYTKMGLDCVRKAYELLESSDWKVEKVNSKGDTIRSTQRDKLGKIFRLTARIKYPAKELLQELFYKIEEVPKWNPTLLESKIVRKVNSYTDITYQATVGGGGGMVKSRDFINLRCWRLFRNGRMCANDDDNTESSDEDSILNNSCEGSVVSTVSECESHIGSVGSVSKKLGSSTYNRFSDGEVSRNPFETLSKSLGAKDFSSVLRVESEEPPPLDDEFVDAQENVTATTSAVNQSCTAKYTTKDKVWINAAISVEYPQVPSNPKYTRGENIVACFAMREIAGKSDACIFEWILCLDLKGYIPRYVLDSTYTTFMTDYMTYLRKYVSELRQRPKRVPRN